MQALCREVEVVARRNERSDEPFYRMLESAAKEVPPLLLSACRTGDEKEWMTLFIRVFTNLQTIAWVLYVFGMRGEGGIAETCDILHRCDSIECLMLAFYRERRL
jgi:hypothetical protein